MKSYLRHSNTMSCVYYWFVAKVWELRGREILHSRAITTPEERERERRGVGEINKDK